MSVEVIPYGPEALLVRFAERMDPQINTQVHALERALRAMYSSGLRFCVPAYASLLVGYESGKIARMELSRDIKHLIEDGITQTDLASRLWRLPVCFDTNHAQDQEVVLLHTKLRNWSAFVQQFTSLRLRVFMLGFLPGFPYMGMLPQTLSCPRKASPRIEVPAGSVAIAGQQAGIYPATSPGGWQLVGRTPVPLFSAEDANPALLTPGDIVEFEPISVDVFTDLQEQFQSGKIDLRKWQVQS